MTFVDSLSPHLAVSRTGLEAAIDLYWKLAGTSSRIYLTWIVPPTQFADACRIAAEAFPRPQVLLTVTSTLDVDSELWLLVGRQGIIWSDPAT